MSFDFIKDSTRAKFKTREPWQGQKNNHNIIDVSLCAGQMVIPGKDDKYFSEFVECLDVFTQKLSALFPFVTFCENSYLHATLLTLFNDSESIFIEHKRDITKLCQRIITDFKKYKPLTILFQEVLLTSNGSIILVGESPDLFKFRHDIYNQYNIPDDLKKNIIHITLGRLLQNESIEKMERLHTFLHINAILSLPALMVHFPKFILSRDTHCIDIDTELTSQFNQW